MANNLAPPKIAIFERVIWSAGRQKSLSVRSGGAGFGRFRHRARNCPFDTSHLARRPAGERDQLVEHRRAGGKGGCRAEVPKSTSDAGGGESAGFGDAFLPGAAEVFGEVAGEPELGVGTRGVATVVEVDSVAA